ncbi:hypothetical protein H0H81_004605 [Sphagnurus paluster]|uniref:HMG box domain-containing protein n=1 Tax=Sphagnurus paluster TaxID=117069 RepID=A0A9P7KJZ0_9AGAR|nr:hypothetical protein H0H81_004605 [Sphagnurus paluster]
MPRRIPRPPNSFILYRKAMSQALPPSPIGTKRTQGETSRIIAQMWKNETPEVKADFERLAQMKKMEHEYMYPGYRYRPRRKAISEIEKDPRIKRKDQVSRENDLKITDLQASLFPASSSRLYLGDSEAHAASNTVDDYSQEMTLDNDALYAYLFSSQPSTSWDFHASSYYSFAQDAGTKNSSIITPMVDECSGWVKMNYESEKAVEDVYFNWDGTLGLSQPLQEPLLQSTCDFSSLFHEGFFSDEDAVAALISKDVDQWKC